MGNVATLTFAFGLAAVLLFTAWWASGRRLLAKLPLLIGSSAAALGLLLLMVNGWLPFAGGGDDQDYYRSSQRVLVHARSWFDLGQFRQEQAGYPLLLTWASQLVGASLFGLKLVNLFAFLMTAIIWFRIGKAMQGRRLAYTLAIAMLAATPLWVYWMFLLKDMIIVLLQSWFLLGMVLLVLAHGGPTKWIHILLSTILLIPFRVQLVAVNAAVLVLSLMLITRHSARRRVLYWAVGALVLVVLFHFGTDPVLLRRLGAIGESRSLDYATLRNTTDFYLGRDDRFTGISGMVRFSVVFLLGETAGFHAGLLQDRAATLRGLSVVPWILFGLPLFFVGAWQIVPPKIKRHARSMLTGPRAATESAWFVSAGSASISGEPTGPGAATGWLPLVLFAMGYAAVAWIVSDTTRWRMPAYAVMVAVAGYGWLRLRVKQRAYLLAGWICLVTVGAIAYYSLVS